MNTHILAWQWQHWWTGTAGEHYGGRSARVYTTDVTAASAASSPDRRRHASSPPCSPRRRQPIATTTTTGCRGPRPTGVGCRERRPGAALTGPWHGTPAHIVTNTLLVDGSTTLVRTSGNLSHCSMTFSPVPDQLCDPSVNTAFKAGNINNKYKSCDQLGCWEWSYGRYFVSPFQFIFIIDCQPPPTPYRRWPSFPGRRCTCLEQSARSCHFRTFHRSLPVPA